MNITKQTTTQVLIEAMPYTSYRLSPQNALLAYCLKGFTPSSSEYGVGLQLTHRFGDH